MPLVSKPALLERPDRLQHHGLVDRNSGATATMSMKTIYICAVGIYTELATVLCSKTQLQRAQQQTKY